MEKLNKWGPRALLATSLIGAGNTLDAQVSENPIVPTSKDKEISFIVGRVWGQDVKKIPYLIPNESNGFELGVKYGKFAGMINYDEDPTETVQMIEISKINLLDGSHSIERKGKKDHRSIGASLEYDLGPFFIGAGASIFKHTAYHVTSKIVRENPNIISIDPKINERETEVDINSSKKYQINARNYLGVQIGRKKPISLGLVVGADYRQGIYFGARSYLKWGKKPRQAGRKR